MRTNEKLLLSGSLLLLIGFGISIPFIFRVPELPDFPDNDDDDSCYDPMIFFKFSEDIDYLSDPYVIISHSDLAIIGGWNDAEEILYFSTEVKFQNIGNRPACTSNRSYIRYFFPKSLVLINLTDVRVSVIDSTSYICGKLNGESVCPSSEGYSLDTI